MFNSFINHDFKKGEKVYLLVLFTEVTEFFRLNYLYRDTIVKIKTLLIVRRFTSELTEKNCK